MAKLFLAFSGWRSVTMAAGFVSVLFLGGAGCAPEPMKVSKEKTDETMGGTGGATGTGGRVGSGGAQISGSGGSTVGSGGAIGTGGTIGAGGSGKGGSVVIGAGGSAMGGMTAGKDAAGGTMPIDARPADTRSPDMGPAPTFKELYNKYWGKAPSSTGIGCAGSACHDKNHDGFICPATTIAGGEKKCFDSFIIRAEACEPDDCLIVDILRGPNARMPKTGKKLGTAELNELKAWIAGGLKP